jgi:ketosteroid isomerase-like protein
MTDEAQIRQLLDDREAGYRDKDADRILAHNAPEIVVFGLAPPLHARAGDLVDIGGDRKVDMSTTDGVRAWLAGFGDAPFEHQTSDLHVMVGGDVAYAHGLSRMGARGEFDMWFRLTVGLRKADGRWRITHIHESTPFYMDQTGKAAIDLQP